MVLDVKQSVRFIQIKQRAKNINRWLSVVPRMLVLLLSKID